MKKMTIPNFNTLFDFPSFCESVLQRKKIGGTKFEFLETVWKEIVD